VRMSRRDCHENQPGSLVLCMAAAKQACCAENRSRVSLNVLRELRAPRPIRRLQTPPQRASWLLRIRRLRRTQVRALFREWGRVCKRILVKVPNDWRSRWAGPYVHHACACSYAGLLAELFRSAWATVCAVVVLVERGSTWCELFRCHAFAKSGGKLPPRYPLETALATTRCSIDRRS
jgi:hypothetical protein